MGEDKKTGTLDEVRTYARAHEMSTGHELHQTAVPTGWVCTGHDATGKACQWSTWVR